VRKGIGTGVRCVAMEGVERVWHRRLRWRMRGAWQWPAFIALTLADAILLVALPPYEGAPSNVFPGVILAGFVNLLLVAAVAPAVGVLVRRRRPDLPRDIAANYAGAALVTAVAVVLVGAGLLHRSAAAAEDARRQAVALSLHDYVLRAEPAYRSGLGTVDVIRIDTDYYRACIPGEDARHWICLFVSTDQHPPGITRDTEEVSNSSYRPYGGFD
jgi:hypothetical protein